MPTWLYMLAWLALIMGFVCSVILILDEFMHPQHMWIMNVVWPINALYWGPVAVWAYYRWGRLSKKPGVMEAGQHADESPAKPKPFWAMVAVADSHCGAGCTLGDIIAEWTMYAVGLNFFGAMRHHGLLTAYVLDYTFAFVLGIAFQYFTIAPMRGLGFWPGIRAAIQADTLTLTSFEIGLFGWMALDHFVLFRGNPAFSVNTPVYWFMMQIGMILGFLTSYPVNWWLLKRGIKERM
jgi:hypothetical protein